MIEISYGGLSGSEVFLKDVQLTYRPLPDVVADLAERGYVGEPSDISVDYPAAGFSVWSMGSLSIYDLTEEEMPEDDEDFDDTPISEGVSVASPTYYSTQYPEVRA